MAKCAAARGSCVGVVAFMFTTMTSHLKLSSSLSSLTKATCSFIIRKVSCTRIHIFTLNQGDDMHAAAAAGHNMFLGPAATQQWHPEDEVEEILRNVTILLVNTHFW